MILARPQTEADQSARIRDRLTLPSVIGLELPHGVFAGLVPCPAGLAGQIVFPDQCLLNGQRAD